MQWRWSVALSFYGLYGSLANVSVLFVLSYSDKNFRWNSQFLRKANLLSGSKTTLRRLIACLLSVLRNLSIKNSWLSENNFNIRISIFWLLSCLGF